MQDKKIYLLGARKDLKMQKVKMPQNNVDDFDI